ncbi:MAG: transglycosylase SLT domain-containing protein [Marinifilaceae bacterium]|jgi:membrane-bound lytic murein transglycosylase D|nr:transglycosylase SLT domain-containing protein [Marinifilaceae bacterium]
MTKTLLSILLFISIGCHAQNDKKKSKGLAIHVNDKLLEQTNKLLSQNPTQQKLYNANSIPVFPESVYIERMQNLNESSPIALDYNKPVRNYIDAYIIRHRAKTTKILERSELYFPLFEEYLDKYKLPLELKYISVIESALNPKAISRSGAVGLWQFMFNASRMFDLRITSYIDERMDPDKSTEAACKYFKYLYSIFGDWQLALAAYNGGPGVVRDAIHRSGGKSSFWEIAEYLPKQTRDYVPAFIAVNYVIEYYKEHNIVPAKPDYKYFKLSKTNIRKPVSLKRLSHFINLPLKSIRELNPVYKKDIIPASELPAKISLPIEKIGVFFDKEDLIYKEKPKTNEFARLESKLSSRDGKFLHIHTVQAGEFSHKIAMMYSCTSQNIAEWNNLDSLFLNAGQKLKIWVDPELVDIRPDRDEPVKTIKSFIYIKDKKKVNKNILRKDLAINNIYFSNDASCSLELSVSE